MMNTSIDLYNNKLKYDDVKIIAIIDANRILWFSVSSIEEILEYININQTINDFVDEDYVTVFENLKQFMKKIPKNINSDSLFINEAGLYTLLILNKTPKTKKFRKWITLEVMTSLGKYCKQQARKKFKKIKKEIDILHDEIKEYEKQINNYEKSKEKTSNKDTETDYYEKYLIYKTKYLELQSKQNI